MFQIFFFINFIIYRRFYLSDRYTLITFAIRRFSRHRRNRENNEWGRNWIVFAERISRFLSVDNEQETLPF